MAIICRGKRYPCSFELALEMFSGKWTGLVLWHLSQHGTMRYNELKRAAGNITQKMLTQTLRELEANKLVDRKVYPVVPPKVEYTLTEHALKLIEILEAVKAWGDEMVDVLECEREG